ncbi:MAG: 3-deoxy-7-phosphoheptulonate synthase [Lachnospiraceae bacterium]|nr:3-deoxy-7-phosphoheptulonate synthase [Candidatus Colinaster equi]
MKYIRKLPEAEELFDEYSLTPKQIVNRQEFVGQIRDIISGKENRKLLLVGPCSADREDSVLDYVARLAKLNDEVKEKFLIIPRVYTGKPRTSGMGYKGLLHHPYINSENDDLLDGIIAARRLHYRVIQETGLFCVDEMLYPESIYYFVDLLAYIAVGARSVEDQSHRMTASGIDVPVGMKNPVGGDTTALLNSILAAQNKHLMSYRGYEVQTEGNDYAHAILRGYVDNNGKNHSNYHYEDLCDFHDKYVGFNLKNMGVIIDCNHSNSGKQYNEQIRIAKDVFHSCKLNVAINSMVKGLMIESYIEDGNQIVGEKIYGKSITDACIGWEKTERLIRELAESV